MRGIYRKTQDLHNEYAIVAQGVTKSFKMHIDKSHTLKETLLHLKNDTTEEYNALRGIDLSVKRGEVLGIVGKNGCGKSTLLKLLAGIMVPNEGVVEVNGKLSCLIELGAGFHPDFTGRENIYTNASIFGMSRAEINAAIDEIIEFSELGPFIDNPVRTYSSGMYLKLAFSVAIHIHPEILLIDEILAVGDAHFQQKCFQKLEEIRNSHATIVIVSHDLGSLERFCSRVIWIHDGVVRMDGIPLVVTRTYQDYMLNGEENYHIHSVETEPEFRKNVEIAEEGVANRWGNHEVIITDAFLRDANGNRTTTVNSDKPVTVEIHYQVDREQDGYVVGVGFYNMSDVMVFGTNTRLEGIEIPELHTGSVVQVTFPRLQLARGKYHLHTSIIDRRDAPLDFYRYYNDFEVTTSDTSAGTFLLDRKWTFM